MFQLPRGIEIENLDGIREGYSVSLSEGGFHVFTINVSANNILRVFTRLAAEVKQPGFLLLESGTHQDIEKQLRKNETDPFHRDVYYLDGLRWADADEIVDSYSELLVHDGEINFGFGSHDGHDEVFVGPYKVFSIYADQPEKYIAALTELQILRVDRLKTVWENFTPESPGRRKVLTGDSGTTIWDMIGELKQRGLYLAERRED